MIRTLQMGLVVGLLLTAGDETPIGLKANTDSVRRPPVQRHLTTEIWDFGIVTPGTESSHRFSITNKGAEPWTLKKITRTCSCAVGELSPRTLRPSETAALEVAYRAQNREGSVYQSVMVEFKERRAPLVCLVLRGEVRNSLAAFPSSVDFGRVATGMRISRSTLVRNYSGQDLAFIMVEAPPWLQAECSPREARGQGSLPRQAWKLDVRADTSKMAAGTHSATLVVRPSSEELRQLLIPVSLYVKAPLEVVPGSLTFDAVQAGTSARRTLLLEVSPEQGELTEKDFFLTHDLGSDFNVLICKTAAPDRFLLHAEFRPQRARGLVKGELAIKTRGGAASLVRVPITGEVR